jgi:hypothetical protein
VDNIYGTNLGSSKIQRSLRCLHIANDSLAPSRGSDCSFQGDLSSYFFALFLWAITSVPKAIIFALGWERDCRVKADLSQERQADVEKLMYSGPSLIHSYIYSYDVQCVATEGAQAERGVER